jgi:hypothetical protein
MPAPGIYVIDKGEILRKGYSLLCLFFANKEIARRSDPDDARVPLSSLESMFFPSEASRLLIETAVAVRVLDDQMRRLPEADGLRSRYEQRKAAVDKYSFALFTNLVLDLRETCNKIIHSEVMEPHTAEGSEPHEFDSAYLHGEGDRTIDWTHLNGYVRLAGAQGKREWYVLLDVEVFVSAVFDLLRPLMLDLDQKTLIDRSF